MLKIVYVISILSCSSVETDTSNALDIVIAARDKAIASGTINKVSEYIIDDWVYFEEDSTLIFPCIAEFRASDIDSVVVIPSSSTIVYPDGTKETGSALEIRFKETPDRVKFYEFCNPD